MGTRLSTAAVLFTTGCNAFFGLEDTVAIDARRPDAIPYASLLYASPTAVALPGGLGDPTGIAFLPIRAGDVSIRIGKPDGELTEASYDERGQIGVPDELIAEPWRIEYTLGGVVHELVWKPERDMGKIVVPAYGAPDRPAMPAGAAYAVTPTRMVAPPAPTTVTLGRAYTTGVWSAIDIGNATVPVPVNLDRIGQRVGGVGELDPSKGDHLLLVDYQVHAGSGCTLAKGTGAAPALDPVASTMVAIAMPWAFTGAAQAFFTYQDDALDKASLRLRDALATRGQPGDQSFTAFGYAAEITMPAFVPDPQGGPPAPTMIELAKCNGMGLMLPLNTPAPPDPVFSDPIALDAYPRIAHTRITNSRASSANGPGLFSGISAVTLTPTMTALELDLRMPYATAPRLESPAGMVDLDAVPDQTPVPVGDGTVTLTFGLSTGFSDRPDYLEVTLYRVVNSPDPQQRGLFAERVYTNADLTAPRFVIDAKAAFTTGAEYVFALRAYNGRPAAARGDFAQVTNQQTVTTIFTRTFVAQ